MHNAASSEKQTVFIPPFEACHLESQVNRRGDFRTRIGAILREWARRYRSRSRLRRQLREMDTYLAEKDVGLPMGTLAEEAGKPFWRA
ncbi:hypothetical protein RE428_15730 [Marinobacter nanhaiticus D15-8W]|uniref:DUF1127 domain-containing protein n=1 Tax=Marinobacter nanhaiticus D15-8W TaxID=626887 RepID=N6VZ94_9GAMM|nr:hypothetical protein [Marinobacter nanhaiticus]ENO13194.1 hypothetical protein J057_17400 [Marinobacter nanhaiticus D15-8W]BES70555.1 hypothetical protein RE428_15730 [Marinobacter nanhaiticus D15-8W]